MKLPPLILASASPRRAELLQQHRFPFTIWAPNAAELAPEHLTPREAALVNAHRKARLAAKRFPDALVLGADTVVCLGTRAYGKPATLADAERMLRDLAGRTHQVITGVCLIHSRGRRERLFAETTDVTFRPVSVHRLREYLSLIEPLDKAGAYAIQDHGDMIVERYDGSLSNVIGLPVERLREELAHWDEF